MSKSLDEQIAKLSKLRNERDLANKTANQALEDFMTTDRTYSENSKSVAILKTNIAILESEIRDTAIAEYENDKNKHPHKNVEIKLFSDCSITDKVAAKTWAIEHDADCLEIGKEYYPSVRLQLMVSAPEKVDVIWNVIMEKAKKEEIPGIVTTKFPKAQISTKLED
jgi:hypothetical protein